jgi:hypothetical protein
LERPGLVGLLSVGVNHGIIFPSKIENLIIGVASASDVELIVDNAEGEAASGVRKWQGPSQVHPCVRHWIILPSVRLGAAH